MKRLTLFTVTSVAALSLAACNSEDVENTPIDDVDELVDEDEEVYPQAGELSEEQQANLDAMDATAVGEEYERNRATIIAEAEEGSAMQSGESGSGDSMSGDSSAMDSSGSGDSMSDSGETAMASAEGGASVLPDRSAMSFDWLDRNEDGRLSVAEYAVWALPTDPTDFADNDQTRPYLTPEQINEAGQTFFYFDDDGNTYLSETEFEDARASTLPSLN